MKFGTGWGIPCTPDSTLLRNVTLFKIFQKKNKNEKSKSSGQDVTALLSVK